MPTALELTHEGWKSYLASAQDRVMLEATVADADLRELLLNRVREAAAVLKSRFGVRRVILFGSLAYPSSFVSVSDVDLAVEGLEAVDYWKAWGAVEEVIHYRPVDFVEMERASEALRRAIARHGVEL